MALQTNVQMVFTDYIVRDDGIQMDFLCATPGAGEPSVYTILLTDTELGTVATQIQLQGLVTTKLQRKWRAAGIDSKLSPFIGSSITI